MNISKLLIGIGLTLTLASCADESPFQAESSATGQGGIKLSLRSNTDYSTSIPKVRAAEIQTVTPPPASAFQIRLAKVDGSYAQTWNSLEEFAKEDKFSVGVYELEAFYGSKNSQGVVNSYSKGYENAYYYGKIENITVLEGQDTPVTISASLANSLVMVEYTDAFKSYFSDWSTTLQTSGPEDVVIGNKETMAYVTPGDVDIVIDAVLQNGKSYFLNPALFIAEPQHLYKIKYNIFDGEVGNKVLEINFNDDPTGEENVYIELNDQLSSTEAPVITTNGFKSGEQVETQVGVPLVDKEIKMSVFAPGGLQKAIMKVVSSTSLSTGFLTNGEIDLCKATSSQQSSLASSGIKARGFFDNPDKMAHLDLTEFSKYLPAGRYTISLQVTDKLSQTNTENIEVTIITVNTNSYIIEDADVKFGDTYADVMVSYDGPDPTQNGANPFSFKLGDSETGIYMPVEILGIGTSTSPLTKAFTAQTYTYRLRLPEKAADYYPIEMYFNEGSSPVDTSHQVNIVYPSYDLEYDAFARKLKVRFVSVEDKPLDETLKDKYLDRLRLFVNGSEKELSIDKSTGIITITGLTGNQIYSVNSTLKVKKSITSSDYMTTSSIQTEEELQVPNGDFEILEGKNYSESKLDQGGKWGVSAGVYYQNYVVYTIKEASEWATTNDKTLSGSKRNTLFCQPSVFNTSLTYRSYCPGTAINSGKEDSCPINYTFNLENVHSGNNAMVIRNVGWDPSGTVQKDWYQLFASYENYYNHNNPQISNRSVGKMFLGKYTFENGQENYIEGTQFATRPSILSGWYYYSLDSSKQTDNGIIKIELLSENEIIAWGVAELNPVTSYSKFSINLNYNEFGRKADELRIMISSSKYGSENINEEMANISVTTYNSKFESYQHGATLVVDDFKFEY